MFHVELKATVPRKILDCAAVSREINFTSKREIRQFRLEQRVFLDGSCIEGKPSSLSSLCLQSTVRDGLIKHFVKFVL